MLKERLRLSARQEFASRADKKSQPYLDLVWFQFSVPNSRFQTEAKAQTQTETNTQTLSNTRSPKSIAYLLVTINAARQAAEDSERVHRKKILGPKCGIFKNNEKALK